MYHFISGYTAKVAGTEMGVTEPEATFSACFGSPFLVWHPTKYAEMLAEKMKQHGANTWLVNTGWTGGPYGVGKRMSLPHTRAIIDAIHSGELDRAEAIEDPLFGLQVPTRCTGVPDEVLVPRKTWKDTTKFDEAARKLANLFQANFKQYEAQASDAIKGAGPRL
jgi:phosphoenolpyruvate carboxykinase (ATP)